MTAVSLKPARGEDQATGLRRLVAPPLRVLPVCAAARGCGYTAMVVNLAAAIAATGQRVIIIDAGRTMAAPALGLKAKYDLLHLLRGERDFAETILATKDFRLLPAGKGLDEFIGTGADPAELFGGFASLTEPADLLLLAAPAPLIAALLPPTTAPQFVLTIDAEPVQATYAQLKRLAVENGFRRFGVVLNKVDDARRANDVYARLADAADRFLQAELTLAGIVPTDAALQRATAANAHVFGTHDSPARSALARLAAALIDEKLFEIAKNPT